MEDERKGGGHARDKVGERQMMKRIVKYREKEKEKKKKEENDKNRVKAPLLVGGLLE